MVAAAVLMAPGLVEDVTGLDISFNAAQNYWHML
jgi:UPF0716 family protein affecting phage T7 exclusion